MYFIIIFHLYNQKVNPNLYELPILQT